MINLTRARWPRASQNRRWTGSRSPAAPKPAKQRKASPAQKARSSRISNPCVRRRGRRTPYCCCDTAVRRYPREGGDCQSCRLSGYPDGGLSAVWYLENEVRRSFVLRALGEHGQIHSEEPNASRRRCNSSTSRTRTFTRHWTRARPRTTSSSFCRPWSRWMRGEIRCCGPSRRKGYRKW